MRALGDPLSGADAVEDRHLDVEDDEIGAVLVGEGDGSLAVAGFTDDLPALFFEHLLEIESDQRLVLGEDDPARGAGCVGAGHPSSLPG